MPVRSRALQGHTAPLSLVFTAQNCPGHDSLPRPPVSPYLRTLPRPETVLGVTIQPPTQPPYSSQATDSAETETTAVFQWAPLPAP